MGVPTITSTALIRHTTTATEKKETIPIIWYSPPPPPPCAKRGYLKFQWIRAKSDMHEMVRKIWPKQFRLVGLQNESKTSYLSESGGKRTACNISSISSFNHWGHLANRGFRACAVSPLLRSSRLYELKIKCVVHHKYCMAVALFSRGN